MKLSGEGQSEPEGGRAAERLRDFLRRRLPQGTSSEGIQTEAEQSIETDGATVPVLQPTTGAPPAAQPPVEQAITAAGTGLPAILEKAAALRAQNAGPAPSLTAVAAGPIPFMAAAGDASQEAILAASAGSPSPSLYGLQGCCQ